MDTCTCTPEGKASGHYIENAGGIGLGACATCNKKNAAFISAMMDYASYLRARDGKEAHTVFFACYDKPITPATSGMRVRVRFGEPTKEDAEYFNQVKEEVRRNKETKP